MGIERSDKKMPHWIKAYNLGVQHNTNNLAYQTALNLAAPKRGRALIYLSVTSTNRIAHLRVTKDGNAVVYFECKSTETGHAKIEVEFNESLLVEHKVSFDIGTSYVQVGYYYE